MTDLTHRARVLTNFSAALLIWTVLSSSDLDGSRRLQQPTGCAPCGQAGQYRASTSMGCDEPCRLCAAGTFTAVANLDSCRSCPTGRFQAGRGRTECEECPQGRYEDARGSNECKACPEQTYNDMLGSRFSENCKQCEAGYDAAPGSPECAECNAGSATEGNGSPCEECTPGRVPDNQKKSCVRCESGKYAESIESCTNCPEGRWIMQLGASHVDECRLCSAGRSSGEGATGSADCFQCTEGKFSVPGGACQDCPPGTASVSATKCVDCAAGKFSETEGATECKNCAAGRYRASSDPADQSCQPCRAGRYGPQAGAASSSECQPCPAGTKSEDTGMVSFDSCTSCDFGRFSVTGAAICPRCEAGKFSVERSPACSNCEAGHFASSQGLSRCSACLPGKYRPYDTDPSTCLDCEKGKASNETGAMSDSVCQVCGLGRYSSEDGAKFCSTCPPGTYNNQQGTSECASCQSNSGTPSGALGCCPLHGESFPVSPAESLYTPPGKNQAAVHILDSCGIEGVITESTKIEVTSTITAADLKEGFQLATLKRDSSIQECVSVSCSSYSHCLVSVESDAAEFTAGEGFNVRAHVRIWDDGAVRYRTSTCPTKASVKLAGYGCAPNTLMIFFLCLTGVVVVTVVIALLLEALERQRHIVFVECSIDLEIPSEVAGILPTTSMLHQTIQHGLNIKESVIPRNRFNAYIVNNPFGVGCMLHIDFGVLASRKGAQATRKALLQTAFAPPPANSLWRHVKVEQQQPTLVKARGRLPGMDLVEFLEKVALCMLGGMVAQDEKGDKDMAAIHLAVARELLKKLSTRSMRFLLWLQYSLNLIVAGTLSAFAYYQMTTCEKGYPISFHVIFFCYIATSGAFNFMMLLCFGGKQAKSYIWRYRNRLLLRYLASIAMLTDTYQDTTFPVIAKRCGFDLWFVSAWLVVLGIGVMQVLTQAFVLLKTIWQYYYARTPEERERLMVEGAFLALRGSDNLVLVHAVRPAVEERLGGASSWAMKMSEARIAFFRFLFEDVEQSALQFVFLLFYEDANMVDKIWVGMSAAVVPLLSLTLVVQCLPEVRDWLWYRVLAHLPLNRRFPYLRVVWLLTALVIYRMISVFPWISACSPSGDPCTDATEGLFWKIVSCNDGELAFFGLAARKEVLNKVLETSGYCLAGMGGSVVLAAFVWWAQKAVNWKVTNRWVEFKNYSVERRFASIEEPLRPKTDEDDDHWLEDARQLRALAIQVGTEKGIDTSSVVSLVESIDKQAFKLSRAPLPHRYSCRRVNIGRKLGPRINSLGTNTTLNLLGDNAKEIAGRLCAEASHAQQVAYVRWNAQRLLSYRQFLRSSLVQKANYVKDATGGYAPLRFIHWAQLEGQVIPNTDGGEASPSLPKCFSQNGAEEVPEVLARVAERLKISVERAERHVIPFFLSHRWLRTRGPKAWHHPDTEDNLKAKRLVAFAKWFMELAAKHRLKVEVIFWIDWCCTDQDDLSNMDLAVAALPLYIASCVKVVVWKTPDFERRCWTMVERLLSYSFCQGGLTPYVIDETFTLGEDSPTQDFRPQTLGSARQNVEIPGGPSEADLASFVATVADTAPRIWQINLGGRKAPVWSDYDEVSQAVLREARTRGQTKLNLTLRGQKYEMDLEKMVQKNLKTGMERSIREKIDEETGTEDAGRTPGSELVASDPSGKDLEAGPVAASARTVTTVETGGTSARSVASGSSVGPSSIGKATPGRMSGVGSSGGTDYVAHSAVVHRRARKLPNPLDFDTCQVTRLSDRRRVAQLVDIALTVPALEVFADRQPVEWGLTEVVEQSLARRAPLPNKWKETREAPKQWLMPVLQAKADWQLIVENGVTATKAKGRLHENTGAHLWVDYAPQELSTDLDQMNMPAATPSLTSVTPPAASGNTPPGASLIATPAASGLSPATPGADAVAIDRLFDDVDTVNERQGPGPELNEKLHALIMGLKADLGAAAATGSEAAMEAAILRTREVELPEKQLVCEKICAQRLRRALQSGKEPVMRAALRMARLYGAEHLQIFADVRNQQQKLYNAVLHERLKSQIAEAGDDLLALYAVSQTAAKHGLSEVEQDAWQAAKKQVDLMKLDGMLMDMIELQKRAEDAEWKDFARYVKHEYDEITLQKAMEKARDGDHVPELRAIEKRAKETGFTNIANQAGMLANEVATRVGERMGLPPEWDVVLEQIGAPGADMKLLKKQEEKNQELIDRVQKLVNETFTGFGPMGKMTRTRDRAKEPIAKRIEVMSVVHVQNAESYVNYRGRRGEIVNGMPIDAPRAAAWDVKTCRVTLEGVGKHKNNPVDPMLNEYYLWHGTTPKGAQGITDTEFDMKRAGSAYGTLFGPGIYFAESCMKADEYTQADKRGYMPLLLCRVILGKINYCDAHEPKKLSSQLEHSCRPGGPFNSVLGDREKVRGTFREFIVFDNHQVYPEYIVWYQRKFE